MEGHISREVIEREERSEGTETGRSIKERIQDWERQKGMKWERNRRTEGTCSRKRRKRTRSVVG